MDARSAFRLGFKIFNWGTLVLAVITVALVFKRPPPPDIPTDPQAAQRFQDKMKGVAEAHANHQPAELHLQPAEINAWLQQVMSQDPGGGIGDVKADLVEDRVRAYAMVNVYGKDLPLMLEGRLGVSGGYLTIEPTAGKLGSLSLPASAMATAMDRMFNSPENHEKMKLPPEIGGIRVQNGELVVAFK